MNARRLALALPILAAMASPAAAQRAGLYDVTGTNLDGTPYTGQAQIRAAGLSSFVIAWRISGQVVEGVGFASGRTIAVAYGLSQRPGLGIYTLNPDGSMDGEWTIVGAPANARERLVPRDPAPATAAPAAPAPAPAPAPN
ncbi:hypothetical protein G3576_05375 [Roseomonas stagni]|uniref:Uncharacterized protein n=1 Tax=Falsiroseomonas algicola TaxID=2716930 RepID=A0A6M1LGH4_9PROT|nr:hypothetical protein [Falsiroseomonas algicola]NGM19435.1 hypothetical protein [Falsiroseomonas algicola]